MIKAYLVSVTIALGFAPLCVCAGSEPLFLKTGPVLDVDIDLGRLGGDWFAIHQKNKQWVLSKTKISTGSDDGIIDIRSRFDTVSGLLKNVDLTEGPLESASLIVDQHGISNSFLFRGKTYRLIVKQVKETYHSPELKQTFDNLRNDVYFSDGTRQTLIYGGKEGAQSCASPRILWAGDLDRDGKPDIIADFDDDSQKNSSSYAFLSSHVKKNQLLKKAGCQFFSG